MKLVIFNADDFGISIGVNKGIIKSFNDGVLTSSTMMTNMPAFEDAVTLAKLNPKLGVGIHLVATLGKPVLPYNEISSLVGDNGMFYQKYSILLKNIISGKTKIEELKAEFSAQIQKFLDAGLEPTHLDSHQHIHIFPAIFKIIIDLCKKYNITKIRKPDEKYSNGWRINKRQFHKLVLSSLSRLARKRIIENKIYTTNNCYGILNCGNITKDILKEILTSLKDGVTEIICHPGYPDEDLNKMNVWLSQQRVSELNALTDPYIKQLIYDLKIKLISFREVM